MEVPLDRVDLLGRPQAHRRDVHHHGAGHAAARLCRRHHDARATGDRCRRCGRLPAPAPLRPDLHRPRRDHDLLRGDAVHPRLDERHRATADRRARRSLSVRQLAQLLAGGSGRGAGDDVDVRRRLCRHGLGGLSTAVRAGIQPDGGGGLLHMVTTDIGLGDHAHRDQLHRHHPAHACPGPDADEDAGVHLDRADHQHPDRCRVPGADRHARAAHRRPLPGHAFLYQ